MESDQFSRTLLPEWLYCRSSRLSKNIPTRSCDTHGQAGWLHVVQSGIPKVESVDNSQTLLPIVDSKWKRLDIEEGRNSDTFVLELEHGWLVHRSSGFGGGMTFVPKPTR